MSVTSVGPPHLPQIGAGHHRFERAETAGELRQALAAVEVRDGSPGYTVYSMLVGYNHTFSMGDTEVRARFQVNVDNLFGEDTLIYRSYQAYGDGLSQPMDYDFVEPRKFTFTASFTF